MKKLTSYMKEHTWEYLLALVTLSIGVGLDMLSPQLTKGIIDDCIGGGRTELLPRLLTGILIVGTGRCIFVYIREYTFDNVSIKICSDMRIDVFRHLQGLSADFYDRSNTGELMARVKDDVDRISDGIAYISMMSLVVIVHTALSLLFMFRLNPLLTLIPALAMLFCGVLAIFLEKRLDAIYDEISEENAKLNTVAEENLAGVRTVKAFAREPFEIQKFLSHNKRYYELNMRQSKLFVKYHPLFSMVTKLLPLAVLLCGGCMVILSADSRGADTQGSCFTLGSLGAFVQYSTNIVWPMEMLGWLTDGLSSALASHKKLKKIYQEKPAITEKPEPKRLEKVSGDIAFEHVSFARDSAKILSDINFHIKPGGTLGIMGATGSGKTSVIQLLQRLYDCTEGRILLDGEDIRDIPLSQLRGSISAVMQDVFLFSDTISDNVRLGKRDLLDREQIKTAVRAAQADGFVEKLESGYDTVIGERGVGLSGGQKQRISIARALAKKDPVLIMDDSTSALDMETEAAIQQTLKQLPDTTKIIIAHRISAVRHADEILFLDNGRIAERGSHGELLAKKGLYYETYRLQYGFSDAV